MKLEFENKFGRLALVPVTEIRSVNGVRGKDIDEKFKFSLDTAEKIALITDNRGIQISPTSLGDGRFDCQSCFLFVHDSPSTGVVARIETLSYVGGDPTEEIQKAARHSPLWL